MSNSVGLIESKGLVALIEATDVILKNSPVKFLGIHKLENGLVSIAISGNSDYVRAAIDSGTDAGRKVGEIYSSSVIDNPTKELLELFSELFSESLSANIYAKGTKKVFVSSKILEMKKDNHDVSNDTNLDETKIKDDYRREKSKPLLATKNLRATRIRTPKEKSSNNIQIISEEVVTKKDDIKPKIVTEIKPEIKTKENERSIEFPKSMTTIERLRNEALGLTKKRSENIGNVKPEDKKNAIRKTLKELNVRTSCGF